MVKLLLRNGVNMERGSSNVAPYLAAEGGHEGVVKLLLERGADIDVQCCFGYTPLHVTVEGGYEGVTGVLLENRADIERKGPDGNTALHLTAEKGKEGALKLLLKHGADTEPKNRNKRTALHLATECREEGMVRSLLEHGADIETEVGNGGCGGRYRPLHLAVKKGHQGVATLPPENGASMEKGDEGKNTALCLAAWGDSEIAAGTWSR